MREEDEGVKRMMKNDFQGTRTMTHHSEQSLASSWKNEYSPSSARKVPVGQLSQKADPGKVAI